MKSTACTLLLFCLMAIARLPVLGQDSTAQSTTTDTVAVVPDPYAPFMMLNFQFERPDSSFEKIPDIFGFEHKSGARVTYHLHPATFAQVVADFSKKRLIGSDSILIQRKAAVNGINGYLVKMLLKSTDSTHEDHYRIFFLYPHQTATVTMVAVYPRSMDQLMYANILKSFGTMKLYAEDGMTVKN